MSTHTLDISADYLADLMPLIRRDLRSPSELEADEHGQNLTATFDPDLTTEETTVLESLVAAVRAAAPADPDDLRSVLPEVRGLRQYHATANPTAAQTTQAVKAIIRVLRATLRDSTR